MEAISDISGAGITVNRPSTPSPASSSDFDITSLKSLPQSSSYTSLKDLLPTFSPFSVLSLTSAANTIGGAAVSSPLSGSSYEISIRNRLVKHAAWAYLQPAVSGTTSPSSRRLRLAAGESLITRFCRVFAETATRVFDWLVDALWLILCR